MVNTESSVHRSLEVAGENCGMQLPSRNALKQLSRRVRRTAGNVIPEPLNLRELVLPEALTKLNDGTEFLQYDSEGEEGPRIIIFAQVKTLIYFLGVKS